MHLNTVSEDETLTWLDHKDLKIKLNQWRFCGGHKSVLSKNIENIDAQTTMSELKNSIH